MVRWHLCTRKLRGKIHACKFTIIRFTKFLTNVYQIKKSNRRAENPAGLYNTAMCLPQSGHPVVTKHMYLSEIQITHHSTIQALQNIFPAISYHSTEIFNLQSSAPPPPLSPKFRPYYRAITLKHEPCLRWVRGLPFKNKVDRSNTFFQTTNLLGQQQSHPANKVSQVTSRLMYRSPTTQTPSNLDFAHSSVTQGQK